MPLPLVPIVVASGVASGSSLVAAGVFYFKQLEAQLTSLRLQTAHLERSAETARQGTLWSELLEPIAKRWSGSVKLMALGVVATSSVFILVSAGVWLEMRHYRLERAAKERLKAELQQLKEENDELRRRLIEDRGATAA
mmetsp:Transcript_2563/g.6579  ORF Transcript_2563/g.6579 Transcript_2563/m.6579 type:complete len:139 (-) Transcript_2563:53-469(-)